MGHPIHGTLAAANSKLAQFLRRKEEEEMILQIGKRKPKDLKEQRPTPGRRARWTVLPDFKVPTCMVDRPRTSTGATSFHFSYISISKQAVPTINGKPVEGAFGMIRQSALEHSKYIERDGAAEVSAGAHQAGYIERPDLVESVRPSALLKEAIERPSTWFVNETPTNDEAAVLGVHDTVIDGVPSVFSNISDDRFERQEYWRAVERCERTPRSNSIMLDPETSPCWWDALPDTEQLDAEFKNYALTVAEQYRQWAAESGSQRGEKKPFRADPFAVDAELAGKLIKQAMSMPGFDHSLPPLDFGSGRGGRIQIRFIAELPHEITPEDRALIVQNFCDRLARLESRIDPDGTKREVGMMYTAVIHAPDAHNDSRNYHLHIVAHDRPAHYLEEHGMWDFEFQERYVQHRKERIRYPFRQNKIGEIARAGDGADYERAGRNFIPAMRRDFAKITNAVLTARGIERRYDPRTYAEMGIDRTPTEHLGTKAAALESIGVPTAVGQLNAIAIWADAERSIEMQARESDARFQATQRHLTKLAEQTTAVTPEAPALAQLNTALAQRARLIEDLAEHRRGIMAFDHQEAKAKSRAIRTRQTCIQFLADIENGKADHSTRVMKYAIQARWKDAQTHIAKIDAALEPHRARLSAAARDVEERERRVAEIDTAMKPLEAMIERHLKAAASTIAVPSTLPSTKPQKGRWPASPEKTEKPVKQMSETEADDEGRSASAGVADLKLQEPAAPAAAQGQMARGKIKKPDRTGEWEANATGLAPSTPLKPANIEGLPITKGTIAPSAMDNVRQSPAEPSSTPEGLKPLRAASTSQLKDVAPETIIEDISREGGGSDQDDREHTPAKNSQPKPEVENDASSGSKSKELSDTGAAPKVDRRSKPEEAALFEFPVQEPSIGPPATEAEYADWDVLFQRIATKRIPIKAELQKGGDIKYTVPALRDEEQTLLNARRFARRTPNRLAGIHDRQQWEVKRLVRWVSEHGQDPTKLIIEGRTAKIGQVRDAVRTLMRNWGRHPDVIAAVKDENARRVEAAKRQAQVEAERPVRDDLPADLTREELLAEAAANYPPPDQVYTPEVSKFTGLLRELAAPNQLQDAADRIHASADAREDVNRHTVELATAYSRYVEGVDLRAVYRDRGGKDGRS